MLLRKHQEKKIIYSTVLDLPKKYSTYKRTHAIQARAVQGSAVHRQPHEVRNHGQLLLCSISASMTEKRMNKCLIHTCAVAADVARAQKSCIPSSWEREHTRTHRCVSACAHTCTVLVLRRKTSIARGGRRQELRWKDLETTVHGRRLCVRQLDTHYYKDDNIVQNELQSTK